MHLNLQDIFIILLCWRKVKFTMWKWKEIFLKEVVGRLTEEVEGEGEKKRGRGRGKIGRREDCSPGKGGREERHGDRMKEGRKEMWRCAGGRKKGKSRERRRKVRLKRRKEEMEGREGGGCVCVGGGLMAVIKASDVLHVLTCGG